MARKAIDREQDRELLSRDLDEIKQMCISLFDRIRHSNNNGLVGRLQTFCEEIERHADLDTLLNCQQKRLTEQPKFKLRSGSAMLSDLELTEKEEWNQRLREQ